MADTADEAVLLVKNPDARADLLTRAFSWARQGRGVDAQRLYDAIASYKPLHPLRAFWPLAATAGRPGEEWATAALKRADLHISYAQVQNAAEILASVIDAAHRATVLAGQARIALTAGQQGEAVALAERARGFAPQSSYAAIVHGAVLLAAGRARDATAPLEFAAAERAGAFALLGVAWFNLEDFGKAAAAYRQALVFDADDPIPANNLMPALLGARDYKRAVAHADNLLTRGARNTSALAFKCVALGELGRAAELSALTDPGALLQTEWLDVPKGYADRAVFHQALAREIAGDPTLAYERNTTKFGHQTGDLARTSAPAVQALNAAMMAAAHRRADKARQNSSHPFDRAAPRDFHIYSWAVVMAEEGHQAPHFHPNGWLSGVYYIDVPDDIRENDPSRHGWLEFGPSERRWHQRTDVAPMLQVCPKPGLLLTFPSYFWHSTRPLRSRKPRISFAFDIIPVA